MRNISNIRRGVSRSLAAGLLVLQAAAFAPGRAAAQDTLWISNEENTVISAVTGADQEIFRNLSGAWALDLAALTAALPANTAIDALDIVSATEVYFSLGEDLIISGTAYADEDVILWNGSVFSMAFDGSANGLAASVDLDALEWTASNDLDFSLDSDTILGGTAYADEDVIHWNGAAFSMLFDGSLRGAAAYEDLDGFAKRTANEWLISFDADGQIGALAYEDADLLLWNNGTLLFNGALYFDASTQTVAANVNLAAVAVAIPTPSPTPSQSPSATASQTPSLTPSQSPSFTPSISPSLSPTGAPTFTPSFTPSISPSQTASSTPSLTPSLTPSQTPSQTPSLTPSLTPSQTPSQTPSLSPSISPTPFICSACPNVYDHPYDEVSASTSANDGFNARRAERINIGSATGVCAIKLYGYDQTDNDPSTNPFSFNVAFRLDDGFGLPGALIQDMGLVAPANVQDTGFDATFGENIHEFCIQLAPPGNIPAGDVWVEFYENGSPDGFGIALDPTTVTAAAIDSDTLLYFATSVSPGLVIYGNALTPTPSPTPSVSPSISPSATASLTPSGVPGSPTVTPTPNAAADWTLYE